MSELPLRGANFCTANLNISNWCQKALRLAPILCIATLTFCPSVFSQEPQPTYSEAGMAALEKKNFAEAERLMSLALKEAEKPEHQVHPEIPHQHEFELYNRLSALGDVYSREQKWNEAELVYKRALAISENIKGFVSLSLTDLAECYRAQRKYGEAEPLLRRALAIDEKAGVSDPSLAFLVNNIGVILTEQGKDSEAEPYYKRACKMEAEPGGPFDPHLIPDLNVLVYLYTKEANSVAKITQANVQRSLSTNEKDTTPAHSAAAIDHLCKLYLAREVETSLKKSFDSDNVHGGPDAELKATLLAAAYIAQAKYKAAEPLLKDAIVSTEYMLPPYFNGYVCSEQPEPKDPTFGNDNPDVAKRLNNLAELYVAQGNYPQAEPLLKRSLLITKNILGENHPRIAATLKIYTQLLRKTGKEKEAEIYDSKIKFILTPQH
jgi:tetratricopeptide (TPR) repeat protein